MVPLLFDALPKQIAKNSLPPQPSYRGAKSQVPPSGPMAIQRLIEL
jgi:hypothetical protein